MSVSPVPLLPLQGCGVGEGGRGKTWGIEPLPLSRLALEVCLLRALGPVLGGWEGGGPAHPPACGAIPE